MLDRQDKTTRNSIDSHKLRYHQVDQNKDQKLFAPKKSYNKFFNEPTHTRADHHHTLLFLLRLFWWIFVITLSLSVEFDWCGVHSSWLMRMRNCLVGRCEFFGVIIWNILLITFILKFWDHLLCFLYFLMINKLWLTTFKHL